jgi:hypothetical protein
MNQFFEVQGKRWVAAAHHRGADIDGASLDPRVALLLELARSPRNAGDRLRDSSDGSRPISVRFCAAPQVLWGDDAGG